MKSEHLFITSTLIVIFSLESQNVQETAETSWSFNRNKDVESSIPEFVFSQPDPEVKSILLNQDLQEEDSVNLLLHDNLGRAFFNFFKIN